MMHLRDSELDAALACAALELVAGVTQATTLETAGIALVNRLKAFLRADGVALGLMKRGSGRCRLSAIAGATEVNRGSELSVAVEQALRTPVLEGADEETPLDAAAAARLQAALGGAAITTCRLVTADATAVGSLLIWGTEKRVDEQLAQRFLSVLSEPLAGTLRLAEQAQAGILRRCLRRASRTRRWILWTAAVTIGLITMLSLPYRIECQCAAEPMKRRFVAAPFAGIFEKSLVRPGDLVAENAVLGRIDGHELELEFAAATADFEQTRKSYDVNLAAGKVAAAQIDKLELARLEQQRKLLKRRLANIEIRSPVAGYVISGDLKQTEGAPLTLGQLLYEIAPLDQMIIEVAIDDDEVAQLREGQPVSIRFEAYRGETFVGRLERIHPRSEIRDSQNVFIGEVVLEDTDIALRPGMNGTARVALENQSLLVGLLERLWHSLPRPLAF